MENVRKKVAALIAAIDQVVIGYPDQKRKIAYAIIADQHLMLESVPGLAKTLLIECLQEAISDSQSCRIQFTPDLKPQDIVGTQIFNPGTRLMEDQTGPIIGDFTEANGRRHGTVNFALADEINRAPGKTQSSLLSAMQERRVYIGSRAYALPSPFMVLATRNPIEQEGTYPLPEAQLDRFGMMLVLDYLSFEDEDKMAANAALRQRGAHKLIKPVMSIADIIALRKQIFEGVYISPALRQYAVGLVRATRPGSEKWQEVVRTGEGRSLPTLIKLGCSPRAAMTFLGLAQVRAACEGRDYVLPEDVRDLAYDVLRHRIMLTDDAIVDNVKADEAIKILLKTVPLIADPSSDVYKKRK